MIILAGCAGSPGIGMASQEVELVRGPSIRDVVTPFDAALACLKPHINPSFTFAVGQVSDHTGKESYTDGGTGKFVTQGAALMVQSALLRAGATTINRQDMNIPINETRWGIRKLTAQSPVMLFISGSINSLDFIPGGGFSARIAGLGPEYRQNRIIVSIDLYMTDAATGRIVSSVPLQKQLFASEAGFGIGRFFGDTLVSFDIGGMEREAVNFALRQMLSFATFELLAQRMDPKHYLPCREKIDEAYGSIHKVGTGPIAREVKAALERLRQTDPDAAAALERELAGEPDRRDNSLPTRGLEAPEDSGGIMPPADRDIDAPEPSAALASPATPVSPANVEPPSEPESEIGSGVGGVDPVQGGQLPDPEAEPAEPSREERDRELMRKAPDVFSELPVRIGEHKSFSRIVIDAPRGQKIRWGLRSGNLVVLAFGSPGPFAPPKEPFRSSRVRGFEVHGNDRVQALAVALACDCGVEGRVLEDGRLVFDISRDSPKPTLRVSEFSVRHLGGIGPGPVSFTVG